METERINEKREGEREGERGRGRGGEERRGEKEKENERGILYIHSCPILNLAVIAA